MGALFADRSVVGLVVFLFLLVVIALGTLVLLVAVTRPLLRRVADTNRALRQRFARFGFVDRQFSRRVFMVGVYDGVHIVAHWFMDRHGVHITPMLVVHAKVPHTSHTKLHVATKLHRMFDGVESFERLVGWREVGAFMLAEGHETSTHAEQIVLAKLSHDTLAHLTDVAAFPHGVALRTGYFTLLYGGATALALAAGDEELAVSMDVEVTLPFSMGHETAEHVLRNIAKAARLLEEDIAV